jgi:hypothetical protein
MCRQASVRACTLLENGNRRPVTFCDRFFSASILGGRLHVQGVPDWRLDRFPENQIVIVPEVRDRMIRTREELESIIREPTGGYPTRNIWIHESLADEARRVWERDRPT